MVEFNPGGSSSLNDAVLDRLFANPNGGAQPPFTYTADASASVTMVDAMNGTLQHLTNATPTLVLGSGVTSGISTMFVATNATTLSAAGMTLIGATTGMTIAPAPGGITVTSIGTDTFLIVGDIS